MIQPTLFDTFDGQTFDYAQDHGRLKTALGRIAVLMRDGQPRTLAEIAKAAETSEAGASARLRDLRKPKWAIRYSIESVDSERVGGGLWLYSVGYYQ
mgnify:FL=1